MQEGISFQSALAEHRRGHLEAAAKLYREVLRTFPDHSDALNLLGTIARQRQNADAAIALTRRALAIKPDSALYQFNYGECCRMLGKFDEAVMAYRRVLQNGGGSAEVYHVLGQAYLRRGELEEAVGAFREAVRQDPSFLPPYDDLAACLIKLDRSDEAAAACREALSNRPSRGLSDIRIGGIYSKLGLLAEAGGNWESMAGFYRRAADVQPDSAECHIALARALNVLGRWPEAFQAARAAVAIRGDSVGAHVELGTSLERQGHLGAAAVSFNEALRHDPKDVRASIALASIELQQLRHQQAIARFEAAAVVRESAGVYENTLLALNYASETSEDAIFAAHQKWAEMALGLSAPTDLFPENPDPERPLRVGYVSPDLRAHPVASFVEPILCRHDRRSVTPIVFCDTARHDGVTERLRSSASEWHDTAKMNNVRLADRVAASRIDILVDLAGHTARNRLLAFAGRLAPIQVTYLGYPNTTGLPATIMQYRVSDDICDPPGRSDELHTERLWRLPAPFLCYRPPMDCPPVSPCPFLAAGHITFGCFNNMMKITRDMVSVWSTILRQVSKARLLLKNESLGDEAVRQAVIDAFEANSVSADRLELMPRVLSKREHLAQYGRVDVALDTFPYNGTATSCESLWMGVPLITRCGSVHRARVGASILAAVGLQKYVTDTPEEYVSAAVRIAQQRDELILLRESLRDRMSASNLMSESFFAHKLDEAYRHMWRALCAGQNNTER